MAEAKKPVEKQEKAAPKAKAKAAPESGHDPETMAAPEQSETGLPRHRVEDGPELPEGMVTLIPPERGPAE